MSQLTSISHIDPIDGLTERLGEFLFSPTEGVKKTSQEGSKKKMRGLMGSKITLDRTERESALVPKVEPDGLTEDSRSIL